MSLSKSIERQLARIEEAVSEIVSPTESPTESPRERYEREAAARMENFYDQLSDTFCTLIDKMPERWAMHVIDELNTREDGFEDLKLSYYGGEILTSLSPVTSVACNIVGRQVHFKEREDDKSLGVAEDPGPLALPEELCQWLSGCTFHVGQYGIVELHKNDAPPMLYRFNHFVCEACSYWHPAPMGAHNPEERPFPSCLLCGGFVGNWYECRDRREKISRDKP